MQKPWKKSVEINAFFVSTEVMESRKVKYGVYDVLIEARVETDSTVVVEKITCDPESSFIVNQFLEAMKKAPKLVPAIKDGMLISSTFKQGIRIQKLKD